MPSDEPPNGSGSRRKQSKDERLERLVRGCRDSALSESEGEIADACRNQITGQNHKYAILAQARSEFRHAARIFRPPSASLK